MTNTCVSRPTGSFSNVNMSMPTRSMSVASISASSCVYIHVETFVASRLCSIDGLPAAHDEPLVQWSLPFQPCHQSLHATVSAARSSCGAHRYLTLPLNFPAPKPRFFMPNNTCHSGQCETFGRCSELIPRDTLFPSLSMVRTNVNNFLLVTRAIFRGREMKQKPQ